MKIKNILIFIFISIILYLVYFLFVKLEDLNSDFMRVAIIYVKKSDNLEAFKSVLEEEGVKVQLLNCHELLSTNAKDIVRTIPVIIFPDKSNQHLPPDILTWLDNYLSNGGNIFISYDVGIKTVSGAYKENCLFAKLLDINYCLYPDLKGKSYSLGYVKVKNNKILQFTPGVLENGFITGYKYGRLIYPYALNYFSHFKGKILAYIIDKKTLKKYIAIAYRKYKKGYIYYVNLPLGYLKGSSDDLILRCNLRAFLFKVVKIPHLLNTPYAKGALVINWHIDANTGWHFIPYMFKHKIIRKNLKYSFHITAGPFRDKPGDKLGFDAKDKGRKYVKMLIPYGKIGSHGGWGHNWFAYNLEKNKFKKDEIIRYLNLNTDTLQNIINYKIDEYSAPNGVHPQPIMTKILEKFGFIAYYFPGDYSSSPTRSFFNGKMITKKVIAFPVCHLYKYASFSEMKRGKLTDEEVKNFLMSLVNYCIKTKQIRLFYSHPYDLPLYLKAILTSLDYIDLKVKDGKLMVRPMSYFAKFLLRFLDTKYNFVVKSNKLILNISNKKGLKGITIAIPKGKYKKPNIDKKLLSITEDEIYYYIYFIKNIRKYEINFHNFLQ